MSWTPPPSFTPGAPEPKDPSKDNGISPLDTPQTNKSRQKEAKTKRKTWVPAFVVGEGQEDVALDNLNAETLPTMQIVTPQRDLAPSIKKPATPTVSPAGGRKPTTSKKVGWNLALFVVDKDDSVINNADDDTEPSEIQIPSRAALGFNQSFFSKKDCLVKDQAMLRTRLQWSQQLVSKAFKPYRQMICAIDDDLPSPEEMNQMDNDDENEDFLEGKRELTRIRNEMLDDAVLNEKEIAAFFEGYKLFQIKVNSLQSQLDSMRAMQGMDYSSSIRKSQSEWMSIDSLSMSLPPTQNTAVSSNRLQPMSRSVSSQQTRLSAVAEDNAKVSADDKLGMKSWQETPAPLEPEDSVTSLKPPTRSTVDSLANRDSSSTAPHCKPLGPSRSLRQMSIQRIRDTTASQSGSDDIRKLLNELEEAEHRQKKLEKQLAQAGVVIAENIPYAVAKSKVESIAKRMEEIGGSDVADKQLQEEYFLLEREMEKYTAALQLTDEWITEQKELERHWEKSVTLANEEAIKKLRRHMPVDVRNRSEATLASEPTPNGKYIPRDIAKKFKRTNVLQLLRIDPEDIVPMHAATLENMRVTGLTLTERRAWYQHLKDVGPRWKVMQGDKMTERKWIWFSMMKSNFKENVDSWQRHVDQYGPPGSHPYATRENPNEGCPMIGKQCPLKADKVIDYDGDYGYPEGPEYFKAEVKKSEVDNVSKAKQEAQEALKQKKAEDRSAILKKHYKGKILQVSLANGSCEMMDEAMDSMEGAQEKWTKDRLKDNDGSTDERKKKETAAFHDGLHELKLSILQFAERSGMQLTGKRDANADHPDIRSILELGLCEEVIETAFEFFNGIEERMSEIRIRDGRLKVTIEQLKDLLEELQERNRHTMKELDQKRPPRSRALKTRKEIENGVKKTLEREEKAKAPKEESSKQEHAGFPGAGGGRGDLLSALKGRGGQGGGPGRGDLLSAVQGRGRGGRGGRGGLLAAVAARNAE